MDMRAFSKRNKLRCESSTGFNHSLSSWSASDWMTAMVGEVGEAANVVKKLNRVRDGIPGNVETPQALTSQLGEELADVYIYLDLLCQSIGVNLADEIEEKFQKTSRKIGYQE